MNHSSRTKASHILVSLAAFVIVVAGMSAAKTILVPFLLAAFIAILSAQPMFWLQKRGLPAWLALLTVIVGIFLAGLIVAGLIGTSLKDFSRDLPLYEAKIRQQAGWVAGWFERIGFNISEVALTEFFNPGAAMKMAANFLDGLGGMLTNGFLILMTVIFMLLEAASFPGKLRMALDEPDAPLEQLDGFIHNVQRYMGIKSLVSLATGILVTVWMAVLGVDYALLWGVLAFFLNFVPNIGSIIAAVPAVLLALVQYGIGKSLFVAAGFLVINLLIGNGIEPRFMGRGLGLSTLVVFLSLLFWGWVLGPVGMLLSVPLTITAKIALESREDTRWMAVLLGPEGMAGPVRETPEEPSAEANSS